MAEYYLDTSAVVKYYHTELGSDWVRQRIDARDEAGFYLHQFFLGEITIAEAAAAFAILARTEQIKIEIRNSMLRDFIADIVARYQTVQLTRTRIESAAALTQRHPLKGYDAIQLAIALDLQSELRALELELTFVTSDAQLLRAAQAEGMSVENPHSYPNP